LGDDGVAIFFALSGFVIAHSVCSAQIDLRFTGLFALRRAIRLDPPYWFSICVALIFGYLSATVKSESFFAPSAGQVLAHLFYVQTILGYRQINIVYWTLCYEVQFYLMFVFAMLLAQRGVYYSIVSYGVLLLIAVLWGTGTVPNVHQGLFFDLWHCFLVGVLAYWAREHRAALAVLVALALLLLATNPSDFTVVSIATALILWLSRATGFIYRGLSFRALLFLGSISYSLYLIHNPILGASFFVLKALGAKEGVSLALSVAACIVAAWLMWYMVERPSMSLAHKIKLRKGSPVVGPLSEASVSSA